MPWRRVKFAPVEPVSPPEAQVPARGLRRRFRAPIAIKLTVYLVLGTGLIFLSFGLWNLRMHRAHAEILLERDPTNTAAAEQSLQIAIAIAQSQKARSFELRAALSLAKLYRAANRDADAHTVLAPAVEGFPPTRQFPELAEAQALLAALSP